MFRDFHVPLNVLKVANLTVKQWQKSEKFSFFDSIEIDTHFHLTSCM